MKTSVVMKMVSIINENGIDIINYPSPLKHSAFIDKTTIYKMFLLK